MTESVPQAKPPAVFLVSVRIKSNTRDGRKFAKHLADCAEQYYLLNHINDGMLYDLNLSRWEPL